MRTLLILTLSLLVCALVHVQVNSEPTHIPGGDDFLQGVRLQNEERWKASLEPLRKAADVYSLVADYSLCRMAKSALRIGEKELAASALEELIKNYLDSPVRHSSQVDLAKLYFESGQFSRVVPLVEAALPTAKSATETANLKLMLARAFVGLNEFSKSNSICWQLVYGSPSTPQALAAVKLIQNVDTPQKKLAVATVYAGNSQSKESLSMLMTDEIEAAEPLLPEILLIRARALELDGESDSAAAIYRRIIELYPKHFIAPAALFQLADYERKNGSFEEALRYYDRIVEGFPASELAPQALWRSASILKSMSEPGEVKAYEIILNTYSKSSVAYPAAMSWGLNLYCAGKFADSREVFEKLLAIDLDDEINADALFWTAKSVLSGGQVEPAKEIFQRVIAEYGESYQAFRARAIIQVLGQPASATPELSADWSTLFMSERKAYQPVEVIGRKKAADANWHALSALSKKELERLRFLIVNNLPEAKLEIQSIASTASNVEIQYALALVLFQIEEYYDSLRIASRASDSFRAAPQSDRILFLLYPAAYNRLVSKNAIKYQIDPLLTLAVMREESHFLQDSLSSSEACGLMQIIPKTGKWLGKQAFGSAAIGRPDLFVASTNIELGSCYLRYLLDKFDNNLVLSIGAYNWGETNMRKWLQNAPKEDIDVFVETLPSSETRRYIKKVFRSYSMYRSLYPDGWNVSEKS